MISKSNNITGLEKLFNDHYSALLLYSSTIVRDRDNAEDIVQQAFISLWQKMDTIDIYNSARSYLYKSVFNLSLDFLKHQKVKKRYEDETKRISLMTISPGKLHEKELYTKLEKAISDLPEQCEKIFRMSRFGGLKYREIAAELTISEKTVENQMVKALKILRESLKEYLPLLFLLINF